MTDETPATVTLTIDGKEVTVPKGTLVIRAAEQLGIIVPRFCDHPLLDPVGACRQCVVDIEGQRKPMMACTTPVADEMVVKTHLTSDVARKAQEGTLEFLLINHPLDCPMCDKGGECPLQDQSLKHGTNMSRFIDEKRRYNKPVAVSPQILLDRERCVLCARCTRFSEQISGDPFIELFERGALEQVAIYEDEPYESYFSGNVIQICPVGALTSANYRFKARPFDVRTAPSVCNLCSAGCTQTVQSRRGTIQRQLARTNMPVNEMWNCDKGRFGFALLDHEVRYTRPQVRGGDGLADATWADALMATVTALGDARDAGEGRVAVLTGSRVADEDAYAVSKYARTVLRTNDVDFRTRFAAEGEEEALAALAGRQTATYADVENAPVILSVGLDPREEVPILFLRMRKAWRKNKAKIVPVGPRMGSLAEYAWRRLPTGPGEEVAALARLGRALGVAGLAQVAASSGYATGHLDDVAAALRDRADAVILVGERAPAGALAAAGKVADAIGGKVAWVPRRAGARGALDAGLAPGLLPGGRRLADDEHRAAVEEVWGTLPSQPGRNLHQVLTDAAAGKIDVLHLIGVDLARDCESPALAAKALATVGTVIVQDLARNETAEQYADVVLPVSATQERSGSLTNWEGRTQQFRQAIDGPDLVQDDWEILVQLAGLLGEDLGFNDLDGLHAELERLPALATTTPWPDVAAPTPVEEGDGPVMITYPTLLDRGTMLTGADELAATAPRPTVAMNPADAERLGISEGDLLEVSTGDGTVRLPAHIEDDIVEGAVFVPTNATDTTAAALRGEGSGHVRVSVTAAQTAEVSA